MIHIDRGIQTMNDKFYKKAVAVLSALIVIAVFALILRTDKDKIKSSEVENSVDTVSKTEQRTEVAIPIVMYHHVLKDESRLSQYIISPDEFEEDLKCLQKNGFETITVSQLVDYVENGAELPEKPIILSFDDGNLSFCEYICPLLEKYGEKAVLSIVGEFVDRYEENGDRSVNYACVNWNDVKRLSECGYVEIENHSYNMHTNGEGKRNGASKLKNETYEEYRKAIFEDAGALQGKIYEKTGVKPLCFTYPYGAISAVSDGIMKEIGFKCTLSCESGINIVNRSGGSCLYSMKRLSRFHNISLENLLKKWGQI